MTLTSYVVEALIKAANFIVLRMLKPKNQNMLSRAKFRQCTTVTTNLQQFFKFEFYTDKISKTKSLDQLVQNSCIFNAFNSFCLILTLFNFCSFVSFFFFLGGDIFFLQKKLFLSKFDYNFSGKNLLLQKFILKCVNCECIRPTIINILLQKRQIPATNQHFSGSFL